MKYFLLATACIVFTSKIFSQTQERYRDSIFSAAEITTVVYGAAVNYINAIDTLHADIYQPQNDADTARAMIVYMHGGGFVKGRRNDSALIDLCSKLAARGYVVASVDYRLGISNYDSGNQLVNASLRAVQDLNGFIRYAKANAAQLKIDTNKIFISGSSAGGITVLIKAFIKLDSSAASFGITSREQLEGKTNLLAGSTSVAAVFSMWGAIFDTSWIQPGDLPVGLAHSRADSTVPFAVGTNKKNRNFLFYGSLPVYNRAASLGIFTALHVYESHTHDLGIKIMPYRDTTVQLLSDFFYLVMHPEMRSGTFIKHKKIHDEIADADEKNFLRGVIFFEAGSCTS